LQGQRLKAQRASHGYVDGCVSSPNLALAVPNEPMWVGCVSLAGDAEALDWYARTRMPVLAWSSQARGFFSGRYAPGMTGETPEQHNVIRTYFSEANWERYRRAEALAKRKGCTLQQIALAWVLHQPLDVYALIGPASVAELDNSLGALDVELSADEVAWLNLAPARTPVPAGP
jgi:aryl-alcohol dehydrogenase-like predicted oxidoreductase